MHDSLRFQGPAGMLRVGRDADNEPGKSPRFTGRAARSIVRASAGGLPEPACLPRFAAFTLSPASEPLPADDPGWKRGQGPAIDPVPSPRSPSGFARP